MISNILLWISIVLAVVICSVLIYGALGNDIGARVKIDSGEIILQKSIDYADAVIIVNQSPDSSVISIDESGEIINAENIDLSSLASALSKAPEYLVFHELPTSSIPKIAVSISPNSIR